MWIDDLNGRPWTSLWFGYVRCGSCPGIRLVTEACPVCATAAHELSTETIMVDGQPTGVPLAFMGAERGYEDYIYLQMLQREWERPAIEFAPLDGFPASTRPSARAAFVLLFWSYFETRLERLLATAMQPLPPMIVKDLLKRYSGVGSRLYDLYKLLFATSYFEDLSAQGFPAIAEVLKEVHQRRNAFAHGLPQQITDELVSKLVAALQDEHLGWLTVFNSRLRSGVRRDG